MNIKSLISKLTSFVNIGQQLSKFEELLAEQKKQIQDANNGLSKIEEMFAEQGNMLAGQEDILNEQKKQIQDANNGLSKIEEMFAEQGNMLAGHKNAILDVRNWIEKVSFESTNAFIHLGGVVRSAQEDVKDTVQSKIISQVNESIHQFLTLRAQISKPVTNIDKGKLRAPVISEKFSEIIKKVEIDFPDLFDLWQERLLATSVAFDKTMLGNAANWGDRYSVAFRNFVQIHGTGRILDVGCGVFGRPIYLEGYPSKDIAGIDPLPMTQEIDFQFVQGISEYLPWPDSSFETIVSGTSLDHSLSLSKSLDEMSRVMTDDGTALLWIGSIPGSPEFLPESPNFKPSDKYHLFHFDSVWFEPILNERFKMIDRVEFWLPHHSHVFYALRKC